MRVRLVKVDGDQEDFADLLGAEGELQFTKHEDFADLIGAEGELQCTKHSAIFKPKDRNWLTMYYEEVPIKTDQLIRVHTTLNNTFFFKDLDNGGETT